MKTIATLLALTATSYCAPATAEDFSMWGQTVSLGAESDTSYTTGVEDWKWELTPYAGISMMGLGLIVETEVDMLKLDEDNVFTGIDVTVDYTVPQTNLNLYSEVSSDRNFKFGNIELGAKIKF